jgi:YqjK-like protein
MRSAEQRATLAYELGAWQMRAQVLERWWGQLRRFRFALAAIAAIVAIAGARSRHRLARWLRAGSVAWGVLRTLRARR